MVGAAQWVAPSLHPLPSAGVQQPPFDDNYIDLEAGEQRVIMFTNAAQGLTPDPVQVRWFVRQM